MQKIETQDYVPEDETAPPPSKQTLSAVHLGNEVKAIFDQHCPQAQLKALQFTYRNNGQPEKRYNTFHVRHSSSDKRERDT